MSVHSSPEQHGTCAPGSGLWCAGGGPDPIPSVPSHPIPSHPIPSIPPHPAPPHYVPPGLPSSQASPEAALSQTIALSRILLGSCYYQVFTNKTISETFVHKHSLRLARNLISSQHSASLAFVQSWVSLAKSFLRRRVGDDQTAPFQGRGGGRDPAGLLSPCAGISLLC